MYESLFLCFSSAYFDMCFIKNMLLWPIIYKILFKMKKYNL